MDRQHIRLLSSDYIRVQRVEYFWAYEESHGQRAHTRIILRGEHSRHRNVPSQGRPGLLAWQDIHPRATLCATAPLHHHTLGELMDE